MTTSSMLTLFCFVLGETSPFPVRISASETVGDIKDAIKAKQTNNLKDIDAHDLTLFQVSLPDEGNLAEEAKRVIEGAECMKPLKKLYGLFPNKPLEETVHIVVKLPDVATKERRVLSVTDSPRRRTVSALYERLMKYPFILVRGTPASGKTTLAELLTIYIETQEPDTQVIFISLWPSEAAAAAGGPRSYLQRCGWNQQRPMVLILDDAQTSYKDTALWIDFLKVIDRFPCRAIAFASYGSPSLQFDVAGTPFFVEDVQRVTLRPVEHNDGIPPIGLLFSREEFDDLVARKWAHEQYYFDSSFFQGVFELTAGHVGAIHDLIYIITAHDSYRHLKASANPRYTWDLFQNEIGPNELGNLLDTAPLIFKRGLPRRYEVQERDIADVFSTVLRNGVAWRTEFTSKASEEALERCFHKGWLQSERSEAIDRLGGPISPSTNIGYVFPSPLHRWYSEWMLSDVLKPQFEASNLLDFVIDVISNFSPSNLRTERRIGPAWIQRIPEAQFQDEFYRSCHVCSNGSLVTFPEFDMAQGRVDFYIPSKKWGVELIREGDRLAEHSGRFSQSGAYGISISLSDYIILDCRTTEPIKKHTNLPNLYHVVFSDNFRNVTIRDNALKLIKEIHLL